MLNEANFDLEAHNAKPAMAIRPGPYGPVPASAILALGAVGSVPASLGVNTLQEFIAYARREGSNVNFASSGPSSSGHIAGGYFNQVAGRAVNISGSAPE